MLSSYVLAADPPKEGEGEPVIPEIIDIIQHHEDLTKFSELLEKSEYLESLITLIKNDKRKQYTILAPSDDAFDSFSDDYLNSLVLEENQDDLTNILKYHILPIRLPSPQIAFGITAIATLQRDLLTISNSQIGIRIDEREITEADILTTNGVIHIINGVLAPELDDITYVE